MKKSKITLGLATLATAFVLAFATTTNANQIWTGRSGTAPNYSPAGTQINPQDDCDPAQLVTCGYEFTNSGQYVGEVQGERLN